MPTLAAWSHLSACIVQAQRIMYADWWHIGSNIWIMSPISEYVAAAAFVCSWSVITLTSLSIFLLRRVNVVPLCHCMHRHLSRINASLVHCFKRGGHLSQRPGSTASRWTGRCAFSWRQCCSCMACHQAEGKGHFHSSLAAVSQVERVAIATPSCQIILTGWSSTASSTQQELQARSTTWNYWQSAEFFRVHMLFACSWLIKQMYSSKHIGFHPYLFSQHSMYRWKRRNAITPLAQVQESTCNKWRKLPLLVMPQNMASKCSTIWCKYVHACTL